MTELNGELKKNTIQLQETCYQKRHNVTTSIYIISKSKYLIHTVITATFAKTDCCIGKTVDHHLTVTLKLTITSWLSKP